MRFIHAGTRATALLIGLAGCTSAADRHEASDTATAAVASVSAVVAAGDSGRLSSSQGTANAASSTSEHGTSSASSAASGHAAPTSAVKSPDHAAPATPARTGPRRVVLGDIDLTGIGYDRGSPTAPVVVIDFSDFGCPYCGQFTRQTYPTLEREYVSTGKVFFKYVPFIVGMFPHSAEATRAVECTAEQGRFWPMADHVYEAQKVWKSGGDPRLLLTAIAGVVGADTAAVSRCYADRHTDARTARATDAANRLGVRVTPSFIVNERPIEGALPLAEFRKVLDAALLVQTAK